MIAGYKSCLLSSWFGMKADRLPPPPPGVDLELADPGAGVGPRWPIGARTGNLGAGAGQGGQRGHTAGLGGRAPRAQVWPILHMGIWRRQAQVWPRGGSYLAVVCQVTPETGADQGKRAQAGVLWAISGYDP